MNRFNQLYHTAKERLKKESPAPFDKWILSEDRLPDDIAEIIRTYSPINRLDSFVPSFVFLQHILYMKITYGYKGFKWMRTNKTSEEPLYYHKQEIKNSKGNSKFESLDSFFE